MARADNDANFLTILNDLVAAAEAATPDVVPEIQAKRKAAFLRLDAYLSRLPWDLKRRQDLSFFWAQFNEDGSPKYKDPQDLVKHLMDFGDDPIRNRIPTDESLFNLIKAMAGPGVPVQEIHRRFAALRADLIAHHTPVQIPKVGRNEPCPCGSGKKYKKCHGMEH